MRRFWTGSASAADSRIKVQGTRDKVHPRKPSRADAMPGGMGLGETGRVALRADMIIMLRHVNYFSGSAKKSLGRKERLD